MYKVAKTCPNEATKLLVVPNPKNTRTTNHITTSVAENGERGHTEVTVCMYVQHT